MERQHLSSAISGAGQELNNTRRPVSPSRAVGARSTANQILARQRSVGNKVVTQLLGRWTANPLPGQPVQRRITRTRSVDTLYGIDLDAILQNPRSARLAELINMCTTSSNTHLLIDTYVGASSSGKTEVFVRGYDGRSYNLMRSEEVNWAAVDKDSPITIKVSMNSGHVAGRAADVETLLHELVVHAIEFVPVIRRMRGARNNEVRGIWIRTMGANGETAWNSHHQRLGEGFNRALTAEVSGMSRHLERQGLPPIYLNDEHWMDMLNHHEYAPHYEGGAL